MALMKDMTVRVLVHVGAALPNRSNVDGLVSTSGGRRSRGRRSNPHHLAPLQLVRHR